MSGYEDAPATALVASVCCVCGRPLVEAESIKSGIGPICAEKTGFGREEVAPEVRAEVNQLVYELAALQRSPEAVPRLARLRELGFGEVAGRVEERLVGLVEIDLALIPSDNRLILELPPRLDQPVWEALIRDLRTVPGRQLVRIEGRKGRRTTLPNGRRPVMALYRVLARHLPGRVARSPKGLFVVPTEAEFDRIEREAERVRCGRSAPRMPPRAFARGLFEAEAEIARIEGSHA